MAGGEDRIRYNDSNTGDQVMAKQRSALTANISGHLKVVPSIKTFAQFFGYFDTEI